VGCCWVGYLFYDEAFGSIDGVNVQYYGLGSWDQYFLVVALFTYTVLNLLFVLFTIKQNETNLLNLWLKVRLKKSEQLREALEKELED
tara:strand:+ start:168 stop:431 length:264 start_codon:yes stop_codon:yes gene_type:complete